MPHDVHFPLKEGVAIEIHIWRCFPLEAMCACWARTGLCRLCSGTVSQRLVALDSCTTAVKVWLHCYLDPQNSLKNRISPTIILGVNPIFKGFFRVPVDVFTFLDAICVHMCMLRVSLLGVVKGSQKLEVEPMFALLTS